MVILRADDLPFDRTGELALHSIARNQIINAPQREIAPAERTRLKAAYEEIHASVRNRRLRGFYNCWGLIFASRRTWVEVPDIYVLLREDKYRQIDKDAARVGDIVLYEFLGSIEHIAVIIQVDLDGTMTVLSQWGKVGEFTHQVDKVQEWFGQPKEYWTEREP